MGGIEAGLMSLATLMSVPTGGSPTERGTFARVPEMLVTRQAPVENPAAGAETNACIHTADAFEVGAIDEGTITDGMRIMSTIGSYYFQRNTGSVEQRLARGNQYATSLENCSADDLRAAAFFIDIWFPELETLEDPMAPLTISARAFATAEIRRRLEQALVAEGRSGV